MNIHFVLDETGSMASIKESTVKGFNEYLSGLSKKDKFSLTLFNSSKLEKRYVNEPVKDVKPLTNENYNPNDMTPLYDAVCKTIVEVKDKDKKVKQVLVIMTDGEENSSKEYSKDSMKALIKELEDTKMWTVVYLGANQDAYANAKSYGISAGNTLNWVANSAGTETAFKSASAGTMAFAASASSSTANFFVDNEDLLDKKKKKLVK